MVYCKECGRKLDDLDDDDSYCPGCGEKIPKSGCFIATACYGSNSEEVQIFRNWRDKTLMESNLGRGFIEVYYKLSPSIANFIQEKPLLKKVIRACLFPIKEIVKREIKQFQ